MLDGHRAKVAQYGTEFSELWSLISQQMRDGKLLRPLIMLETFD